MRLEVGKVVPLDTAEIIAKDYPSVFKMEIKELDDKEAFFYQVCDIISEAIINLGEAETLKLIERLIDKEFSDYSIKKKAKPKPKPRRRRKAWPSASMPSTRPTASRFRCSSPTTC